MREDGRNVLVKEGDFLSDLFFSKDLQLCLTLRKAWSQDAAHFRGIGPKITRTIRLIFLLISARLTREVMTLGVEVIFPTSNDHVDSLPTTRTHMFIFLRLDNI